MRVNYFQRKTRKGTNFSIEYIFEDVRSQLVNLIEPHVYESRFYNNGILSKLYNIFSVLFKNKKDVCHVTVEVHFLNFLLPKRRVILTIHDCGMMYRTQGVKKEVLKSLYLILPVRKAAIITTVSEVTKGDVILFTGCNSNKIRVIPVAVNPIFQPRYKKFNSTFPNILQIGTAPNKNIQNLILALKDIKCHLTIIGKLSENQLKLLRDNNISYTNEQNISNHTLLLKYIESDIVSFVSLYEGFGMPIIEAQSVERPVITSNISSMPEIAGDGACFVNPMDVNSIHNGFNKLIADSEFRTEIIKKGTINTLRFRPEKIARMYYELYNEIASTLN